MPIKIRLTPIAVDSHSITRMIRLATVIITIIIITIIITITLIIARIITLLVTASSI